MLNSKSTCQSNEQPRSRNLLHQRTEQSTCGSGLDSSPLRSLDGGDGTTLPVVVPRGSGVPATGAGAVRAPGACAREGHDERGETDVSPSLLPSTWERKRQLWGLGAPPSKG